MDTNQGGNQWGDSHHPQKYYDYDQQQVHHSNGVGNGVQVEDEGYEQQQNFQYYREQQQQQQQPQFQQHFQYEGQEQYFPQASENTNNNGYQSHQQQFNQHNNSDNVSIATGRTGVTGMTGVSGLTGASVIGDAGGSRGRISNQNAHSHQNQGNSRGMFGMSAVMENEEDFQEGDYEEGEEGYYYQQGAVGIPNNQGFNSTSSASRPSANSRTTSKSSLGMTSSESMTLTKRSSQGTTEVVANLTSSNIQPDGGNLGVPANNSCSHVIGGSNMTASNASSGPSDRVLNALRKSTNAQHPSGGGRFGDGGGGGVARSGLKSSLRSSTASSTNFRASTASMSSGHTSGFSSSYFNHFSSHDHATTTTATSASSRSAPYLGTIQSATREIDVSGIDFIIQADEEASLPESYLNFCQNDEDRILPRKNANLPNMDPIPQDGDSSRRSGSERIRSTQYTALNYPSMYYYNNTVKDVNPFSKKRRNHTFFTAVAALSLAAVGLYVSVISVSSTTGHGSSSSPSTYGLTTLLNPGMSNPSASGYNFVPGYQFGGGIGGLVGGQERERRIQMGRTGNNFYASNIGEEDYAYVPQPEGHIHGGSGGSSVGINVPSRGEVTRSYSSGGHDHDHDHGEDGHSHSHYDHEGIKETLSDLSRAGLSNVRHHTQVVGSIGSKLSRASSARAGLSSSKIRNYSNKPSDPFHGYGPPQFNPEYAAAPQGGQALRTTLTSKPLTSYMPPPSDEKNSPDALPMLLDPRFHGAFMDLSVLPFNPIREVPVVFDVRFSGSEVVQSVFGNCLKMVQCSEEGADILHREYLEFQKEAHMEERTLLRKQLQERVLEDRQRLRMQVVVDRHGGDVAYSDHHHHHPNGERSLLQIVERDQYDEEQGIPQDPEEPSSVDNDSIGVQDMLDTNPTTPGDFDPPLDVRFAYTAKYVNVDCSTSHGVNRAITHELAISDVVDVMYTPNIYDLARMFAPPTEAYGRAVVLVRHPLERTVANYEDFRVANEEMFGQMTLGEYIDSDVVRDNFLTRSLSGNHDNPLGKEDIDIAKEVLKRKFIVGLFDRMQESLERFESFFGWYLNVDAQHCQADEIQRELSKPYNENSKIYGSTDGDELVHHGLTPSVLAKVAEKNQFDLLLFDFAKFLFDYQGRVLFGVAAEGIGS